MIGIEVYLGLLPLRGEGPEDLATATVRLRSELLELVQASTESLNRSEVVSADFKRRGFLFPVLLVRVAAPERLREVVTAVRIWAARNGRTVEITIDGDTLSISATSFKQEELVQAFLTGHARAPSPPEAAPPTLGHGPSDVATYDPSGTAYVPCDQPRDDASYDRGHDLRDHKYEPSDTVGYDSGHDSSPPPSTPAPEGSHGQARRGRKSAKQPDDAVNRAVKAAVKPGLLTFNPPAEMIQGKTERVEVGIARSLELRKALAAGLRGRGEPQVEEINTSLFMGVELLGASFEVTSFSPLEQLVAPIARWEFDVRPYRAGHQTLTLCVSMRIDSPIAPSGRIAVPVLERQIRIRVDVVFGARRFLAKNWQWLIATMLALGGALAAWVTLFR